MKPIITWVLIANARSAKIVVNEGTGKGFYAEDTAKWEAAPLVDYADVPTMTHSRVGQGQRRVEQASPKAKAEADFAAKLCDRLAAFQGQSRFDRLILAATPHMLGEIRQRLPRDLTALVIAAVPKDLMSADMAELPRLLKDHIAA